MYRTECHIRASFAATQAQMPPAAGVGVRLCSADAPGGAPAVHGVSALESLGATLARAGAGALFDTAPVYLAERGAGESRAVLLSLQPPAEDAGSEAADEAAHGKLTPLGRQHELWREIPRLRAGAPEPSKHVKARCLLPLAIRCCVAKQRSETQLHADAALLSFCIQVAAVVIVVDAVGNVLLTRRAASMRTYPGCWVLPGGGVDAGEPLAAAAAREVWEETGLRCAPHGPVAAWESAFPLTPATFAEAGGKLRVHTLMVAFAARVAGARPALKLQPAEVDVATWVAPAELAALLDGSMSAEHEPAKLQGGAAHDAQPRIAAAQLLGVYPNGLTPPEGLGLAHHYTLTVWLAAGCPAGAPIAGAPAPA